MSEEVSKQVSQPNLENGWLSKAISEPEKNLSSVISQAYNPYRHEAREEFRRYQSEVESLQAENASLREALEQARNTNRELNRVKQQLEHTLNVESGRKTWHGYFEAAMNILRSEDAKREKLQAENASLRELLGELYVMVRGECPSLLNEDSGGDAKLDLAIEAALKDK